MICPKCDKEMKSEIIRDREVELSHKRHTCQCGYIYASLLLGSGTSKEIIKKVATREKPVNLVPDNYMDKIREYFKGF